MSEGPIKSAGTMVEIIQALQKHDRIGVRELAGKLSIPRSTVSEHLRTLEYHNLATASSEGYQLSLRLLEIGIQTRNERPIYKATKSEMSDLASKTGAHAGIGVEEFGRGVLLDSWKDENASELPFHDYPGIRMRMHTSGIGKAILAHHPLERVEAILDMHGIPQATENTISDRDELLNELETIRERGFSISRGESIQGLFSIGAPIFDRTGTVEGAISVYGPIGNLKGSFVDRVSEAVIQTANVCEMNLRYEMER